MFVIVMGSFYLFSRYNGFSPSGVKSFPCACLSFCWPGLLVLWFSLSRDVLQVAFVLWQNAGGKFRENLFWFFFSSPDVCLYRVMPLLEVEGRQGMEETGCKHIVDTIYTDTGWGTGKCPQPA